MFCTSRITNDTYSQKFGNNHHKFYVELRCNIPSKSDVCVRCSQKSDTKVQHSRKFNHGKITEPIPDNSHIYGSKWYYDTVKKYGAPSNDSILFAEQYQRDARNSVVIPKKQDEKVAKVANVTNVTKVPKIQKVMPTHIVPTYIETTLEEIDTNGYEIEYIKLNEIEHNGSTYFKDSKNKLYKKIKDKIGTYVGRLHNDSIVDIPDSDDES